MPKNEYTKPTLTSHGSIVSLTLGKPGSDVDGSPSMSGRMMAMSMRDMMRMPMGKMMGMDKV